MNKPKIITTVGMSGSGKGTVVKHLQDKYNLPRVYGGGMVYDEVKARGLDIVMDERAVREDMRLTEGPAVLAKRAVKKAEELFKQGATTVIFDSVYSWSEDKYLRDKYGQDYVSIAIVSPKNLRYQRVVERQDAHRKYTLKQVQLRDAEEIEGLEKGGPIAFADYYLTNAKDITDLQAQVDQLMQSLDIEP